jgi:hypothetical protein
MWPMKVIGALLVIADFFKCQMQSFCKLTLFNFVLILFLIAQTYKKVICTLYLLCVNVLRATYILI